MSLKEKNNTNSWCEEEPGGLSSFETALWGGAHRRFVAKTSTCARENNSPKQKVSILIVYCSFIISILIYIETLEDIERDQLLVIKKIDFFSLSDGTINIAFELIIMLILMNLQN